jgi:hypothetical protein
MMGIYYKKADPDDWKNKLEEANHKFLSPPGSSEGLSSVKKSLDRKDYLYTCKLEPMVSHCDSRLCRTRAFGIDGGDDVPVILDWEWYPNLEEPEWRVWLRGSEKPVHITEVRDLTDHRRFSNQCVKQLRIFFSPMKQEAWLTILKEAERKLREKKAELDTTAEGEFLELFTEFLTIGRRVSDGKTS